MLHSGWLGCIVFVEVAVAARKDIQKLEALQRHADPKNPQPAGVAPVPGSWAAPASSGAGRVLVGRAVYVSAPCVYHECCSGGIGAGAACCCRSTCLMAFWNPCKFCRAPNHKSQHTVEHLIMRCPGLECPRQACLLPMLEREQPCGRCTTWEAANH